MIQACFLPLGAGEKGRRPDALLANRVHSFSCRDGSIKWLEIEPDTLRGGLSAPQIRVPATATKEKVIEDAG